jgi:exopolyphosphatase/guanosine-5'-triphosphate,3'-diphosphate pyrophosphatase
LLVVGPDGTALERRMRITRLGEGVDASHTLSSAAIARTVEVLSDYRRLMDHHRVDRARLVATSAARDATNAQEFLSAAQLAVGVQPELLTGLEEGALSFAGATARLPPDRAGKGPVLVVDVGGGSTELVAGYPAAVDRTGTSVAVASMDVGCVRVTERFLHHDPPLADELHEARSAVDEHIAQERHHLPSLAPGGLLIGLAGTVSTLAALEQGLTRYDRDRIHHFVLTEAMVDTWLDRLAGENSRARAARKGMVEGRADVIMGGTVVLQAVMAVFDRSECLVSEDDILDGLAASLT